MSKKVPFEIGDKFGRLTVLEKFESYVSPSGKKQGRWLCLCDCGNEVAIITSNLSRGTSTSCGCFAKENTSRIKRKHGGTLDRSKGYRAWTKMINRCTNPNSKDYPEWGGRGITISEEWRHSFENFIRDMGERPSGFLLDRIDVNGNYCKENCRWADPSLSRFNTRKSKVNTSGRTGVNHIKSSGNWQVRITLNGVTTSLGTFQSFEKALEVREEAELEYFGEIKSEGRDG